MDGLLWADRLFGFFRQESGGYAPSQSTHLSTGGHLPPLSLCPVYALSLGQHAPVFLEASAKAFGESASVRYVRQFLQHEGSRFPAVATPEPISLLAKAEQALRDEPTESIEFAEALINSPMSYFSIRGIRIYIEALLKLNRIPECVRYATDVYIATAHLHSILSIGRLTSLVDTGLRRQLRADPSVAILYDIYSRHVGEDLRGKLRIIYQEFLAAHGVSRPSHLRSLAHIRDKKYVYFLRHVCVEPIMSGSVAFHGSQEVEDERLAICQLLTELDPDNVQEYQTEIKEITTHQTVQRGMQEVAQSKIFVDVDGVRKVAEKNLREAFNRYRAFAASGVEELVQGVMDALRKARSGDSSGIVTLHMPKEPRKNYFPFEGAMV